MLCCFFHFWVTFCRLYRVLKNQQRKKVRRSLIQIVPSPYLGIGGVKISLLVLTYLLPNNLSITSCTKYTSSSIFNNSSYFSLFFGSESLVMMISSCGLILADSNSLEAHFAGHPFNAIYFSLTSLPLSRGKLKWGSTRI